jgi:hypothetical protein
MSNCLVRIEEPIYIHVGRECNDATSGPRGLSAYEVAVDNGFTGSEQEWLDSLVGSSNSNVTAVFVINEVPNGVLNGVNVIFTTEFNFIPESVEVYVKGAKLKIIEDNNTSGNNTITFTFSPSSTEYILINYIKL